MPDWRIRQAYWDQEEDKEALSRIRHQVFILEQQVPASMEWDRFDRISIHFLAERQEGPIGCARLLPDGHIGRLAVLSEWRQQGIATALLQACETHACDIGIKELKLSAQTHAIPFYEKSGYRIISEPFLDAGILHQEMMKTIR